MDDSHLSLGPNLNIYWIFDLFPPYSPSFRGFPGGSDDKASACNAGDPGSIPQLGRSPGGGNGYPLQYSCLKNSSEQGAWWATVRGVTKSQTKENMPGGLHQPLSFSELHNNTNNFLVTLNPSSCQSLFILSFSDYTAGLYGWREVLLKSEAGTCITVQQGSQELVRTSLAARILNSSKCYYFK